VRTRPPVGECAPEAVSVGKDRIRYFLYLEGRWRWRPTRRMREAGFSIVAMGRGGPELDVDGNPKASPVDKKRAIELNAEWDAMRAGGKPKQRLDRPECIPGSVADCYFRALALREAERLARGITWTKEQKSRDDWPRAWKWLGPEFGDCDPATIRSEHFLRLDRRPARSMACYPGSKRPYRSRSGTES
jgi:hypothetical protein